jgi:hypothetical protein
MLFSGHGSNPSLRLIDQAIIFLVGNFRRRLPRVTLPRWIPVSTVNRIRLGTQMREHVMAAADVALMSQCGNIYWRHDDTFT